MSSAHSDSDPIINNKQRPEQASVSSQQSPSSPDRPRRSRIRFPSELDHATTSSAKESTHMDRRASQRKQYQGLSASQTSPNVVPGEEEQLVRRRVRSTNSDRSAAYSRAQFVAGSSRSRPSGRRIASQTMHASQKVNGGTASLGSSPLSRQSVLLDEEEDEGM